MDKSAKVLMAETVALTSDRMFVEIRYKSLYIETYMVKQIISPPIKLFTSAKIFICKQRNNKVLTWYGRRNDTLFRESTVNRCYNNVNPVFKPVFRLVRVKYVYKLLSLEMRLYLMYLFDFIAYRVV